MAYLIYQPGSGFHVFFVLFFFLNMKALGEIYCDKLKHSDDETINKTVGKREKGGISLKTLIFSSAGVRIPGEMPQRTNE